MAYTDRREPGVYIDIEDNSYVGNTVESGRTVYGVILCDRGPSDQIVSVKSQQEFHKVFGEPNFLRTSQTHYQIDAALLYTSDVLVTRVVPEDSYWSNTAIVENTSGEEVKAIFTFTNKSKTVTMTEADSATYGGSLYSESNAAAELEKVQIGSWIYADGDTSAVARQVVTRVVNETTKVITLTLDAEYSGSTSTGFGYAFVPFSELGLTDINDRDLLTNSDGNVVYYFYANGAGSYYDNLCIRGTRNTDLEKYNLDDDGNVKYKYLFSATRSTVKEYKAVA